MNSKTTFAIVAAVLVSVAATGAEAGQAVGRAASYVEAGEQISASAGTGVVQQAAGRDSVYLAPGAKLERFSGEGFAPGFGRGGVYAVQTSRQPAPAVMATGVSRSSTL